MIIVCLMMIAARMRTAVSQSKIPTWRVLKRMSVGVIQQTRMKKKTRNLTMTQSSHHVVPCKLFAISVSRNFDDNSSFILQLHVVERKSNGLLDLER
jgi:hypothetical protein